ncbi:hypothetical protein J6590_052807 [Homalodisca vitripennis]|nr:hypothetical protein J6590_052807 [Homalodisca vitripennis]
MLNCVWTFNEEGATGSLSRSRNTRKETGAASLLLGDFRRSSLIHQDCFPPPFAVCWLTGSCRINKTRFLDKYNALQCPSCINFV